MGMIIELGNREWRSYEWYDFPLPGIPDIPIKYLLDDIIYWAISWMLFCINKISKKIINRYPTKKTMSKIQCGVFRSFL